MKKFAVLMALILCVTIGGVFANWIYTEGTTASVQDNITFGMSAATDDTARGTFTIEDNNLALHIDQAGRQDYTATLKVSGEIKVTFTPNADFDMDNYAFTASYELTTATGVEMLSYTYDGNALAGDKSNAILSKFDRNPKTLTFADDDLDGVWTATVTAQMIDDLIDLNTFTLNTYAQWEVCNAQLLALPKIAVKIVDTTVVA